MSKKKPASRTPSKKKAQPDKESWSWRRRLLLGGVAAFVVVSVALTLVYLLTHIPTPEEAGFGNAAVVSDHKGRFVGRLDVVEDRTVIPYAQIPKVIRNATVAIEDRNFYRHGGISLPGVVRAAFTNILSGRIRQGGSTITQQYVKNAFVGKRRNIGRKVREAVVAIKLERAWSKDEILHGYLNTIYFGRGAFGVEAGARAHFGIPAGRLTLPQAALLAGLIRSPESLDPSRHEEAAKRRRDRVLEAMARERMITAEERDAAIATPIKVLERREGFSGMAPHFLEAVRRELVSRLGEAALYREGLRVRTTLDVDMQRAAEKAVKEILDRPNDPETALVAIDPATGSVRALVGGKDFAKRQFDLATQGRRQPGSAFKPFVLAAGLEQGLGLERAYRAPASITLPTESGPWNVSNYDHRDYGRLSLVEATANSVNTVYAQLILDADPAKVVNVARRTGITSKLQAFPSLALGTSEVSPLDLAEAYSTFAAGGAHAEAHLIVRITDVAGEERYRFSDPATRVIDPEVAAGVTTALQRVISSGTGRRADIGRPVAGKTGTTENHRDAWFAGYTPALATVVWMGYPEGARTMENVRGQAVVGGGLPARIWRQFMVEALAKIPAKPFPRVSPPPGTASPTSTGAASPGPTGIVTFIPPTGGGGEPPPPPPPPPEPSASEPEPEPSPSQSPEPEPSPSGSG